MHFEEFLHCPGANAMSVAADHIVDVRERVLKDVCS